MIHQPIPRLPTVPVTPEEWRDFDASIARAIEEIRCGGGTPADEAFEALFRKFPDLRPD